MGAKNSNRRGLRGDDSQIKSHVFAEAAATARAKGDYKKASMLYELAGEKSTIEEDPPGITAGYYYEAANCSEFARVKTKSRENSITTSKNARSNQANRSSIKIDSEEGTTTEPTTTQLAISSGSLKLFESACSEMDYRIRVIKSSIEQADAVDPILARESRLLRKSSVFYEQAKRWSKAAEIQRRIAILNETEIKDPAKAAIFYDLAARNFDNANYFNNAVDCDERRGDVLLKTEPLEALKVYKMVARRLISHDNPYLANNVMLKIVLLTASVYNVDQGREQLVHYRESFAAFSASVDANRADRFLVALTDEDSEVVDEVISEMRDHLIKFLMLELKGEGEGGKEEIDLK